jgi:hypothetical protein
MKAYAGIGSRSTPFDIQLVMRDIAAALENDYILRSGGADGADDAFLEGVTRKLRSARTQIFLPGGHFRRHVARLDGCIDATKLPAWSKALGMVGKYHPALDRLTPFTKKLMARNAMQVLGPNLDDPVKFVICWTPEGRLVGGTSYALRIAADYGIQIRNLGIPEVLNKALDFSSDQPWPT